MFPPQVPTIAVTDLDPNAPVPPGTVLLDVREQDEWDAGHAPQAVHIPLGDLPERVGELPEGDRVVVVCRSGARSARATAWLVQGGYDAVNLDGGMLDWERAGLPVV
jgi:rhodanese-related sulfurtransferase